MSGRRARTDAFLVFTRFSLAVFLLLVAARLRQARASAAPLPAAGDLLPRVRCPPGYTARVYAQGLRSPDGLAFSPAGLLYVAEERAGQVSRIDPQGSVTPILSGLDSPEGIAFDDEGNLYVVEDVPAGRLVRMDAAGIPTTLATGLEAPEGVAWVAGDALYITESSLQFYQDPQDLRSRIARVSSSGSVTRVLTETPTIDGLHLTFRSYAGIAAGSDGRLYITNELSGVEITKTVVPIPGLPPVTLTISSTESVIALQPAAGIRSPVTRHLVTPEGLRFASYGSSLPPDFPLYVVEEDIGGEQGRLSIVGTDGEPIALCTGLGTIEDVAVDAQGRLYISEDQNGLIVQITPARTSPGTIEIGGPTTTRVRQGTTLSAAVSPLTTTLPITYSWRATGDVSGNALETVGAGLHSTTVLTWNLSGRQWITVTAINAEGAITGTHVITVLSGIYLPLIL